MIVFVLNECGARKMVAERSFRPDQNQKKRRATAQRTEKSSGLSIDALSLL